MKKITKAEFKKLTDTKQIEYIFQFGNDPAVRIVKNQLFYFDSDDVINIYDYALKLNGLDDSGFYNMFAKDSYRIYTESEDIEIKKIISYSDIDNCDNKILQDDFETLEAAQKEFEKNYKEIEVVFDSKKVNVHATYAYIQHVRIERDINDNEYEEVIDILDTSASKQLLFVLTEEKTEAEINEIYKLLFELSEVELLEDEAKSILKTELFFDGVEDFKNWNNKELAELILRKNYFL